jgi:hypothetical protein
LARQIGRKISKECVEEAHHCIPCGDRDRDDLRRHLCQARQEIGFRASAAFFFFSFFFGVTCVVISKVILLLQFLF